MAQIRATLSFVDFSRRQRFFYYFMLCYFFLSNRRDFSFIVLSVRKKHEHIWTEKIFYMNMSQITAGHCEYYCWDRITKLWHQAFFSLTSRQTREVSSLIYEMTVFWIKCNDMKRLLLKDRRRFLWFLYNAFIIITVNATQTLIWFPKSQMATDNIVIEYL